MNRTLIFIVAFVAWTVLAFWVGREWRDRSADLADSRQETATVKQSLQVEQAARETEHKSADTMATIGAKHEEDRTTAQAVPAAVVAGVRDGSLQLRDDLATCSTDLLSQAVAGTIERDAHAQLRAEVAGAVVQVGRDADNHIGAAQAVIVADRADPGQVKP